MKKVLEKKAMLIYRGFMIFLNGRSDEGNRLVINVK
jgi:hypothetical protein